jgi:hypothetical protein
METPAPLGPPPDEVVYCTLEAAKSALQNHARENGYGISVMSSRELRTAYGCAKGGKYRDTRNPETHESKRRKNTASMKTDCRWSVHAKKCNCRTKQQPQSVKQSASRKVSLGCLPKVNLDILVEEEEFKEKGSKHEVTSG